MDEPRFVADAMLTRLARWLRVLGFDTETPEGATDHELVEKSDAEGRILLTRDRHLVAHLAPERSLLIEADRPLEQLREVLDRCSLPPREELFGRCLICNCELLTATKSDAEKRISGTGTEPEAPIRRCPCCSRVYWRGSHTRRMRAALGSELPEWFP